LNSHLIESERELKELNTTKDKFFSILAHDMKNPIGGFKLLSILLVDQYNDLTDDEVFESLKAIEQSAKSVYSLFENLLNWSRSQTGMIKYNPSKEDLYQVVLNCISQLKTLSKQKNIRITHSFKLNTMAFFDRDMIDTVIRNLISNAIKFTKENGEIAINSSENEGYQYISVVDNGIGIDEKDIERLFKLDSGFTSQGTAKETGTGLGLILCKEFVEKNGGTITVQSEINKGSTFSFSIPIK
jgi:signal transduction histidine kinase